MAFLWTVSLLLASITLAIFIFYKKTFRYWADRGFVHTTPSIPWGDMKGSSFTKSAGEIVSKIYYQFPKDRFVGIWIFHKPTLLVRDPELIKTIFVRDFMTFHDRGMTIDEKREPLSGHLFTLGGTRWRNLRVKLSPTFTSGKMKMMFPIMVECSKQFTKVLEVPAKTGQVIEVKDYAARFTTDIIASAAFGIEANSLKNPDAAFRHYGEKIFQVTLPRAIKMLIINSFPTIASALSMRSTSKDVESFFLNSVRETVAYREDNNVKRNDFLELLIQLMNKGYIEEVDGNGDKKTGDMKKLTFEEAAANAFVFFLAGFETSSTTMQFALYELAKNPEIQQKLREEIKSTLKKHDNELNYDCVMEMSYLSRVIDETLRLHSPVTLLRRQCNKDYKIPDSDLVLPKGTPLLIPVMGLHHDPNYYPSPEKFDPDRFLEEVKSKRHHYTYLPFGEGPRNCIGMRFGLLQTKVGLITLLNEYNFSVASKTLIPMVYDPKALVLSPLGGMHLKITKCTM